LATSPVNLYGAWVATVGPQTKSNGNPSTLSVGKDGAERTQDAHGRYQDCTYGPAGVGNVFYATNTAAQALSVASSTYTGLIVQNPVGNNKVLSILEVSWASTIAATGVGAVVLGWGTAQTAGVPVALTTGNSSGPTGVSPVLGLGGKSSAQVGASCTFSVLGAAAAPTILRPLLGIDWVTANAVVTTIQCNYDFGGSIAIYPGYNLCIEAITTAITGLGYISWEEINL
jgi:hypothetical protein